MITIISEQIDITTDKVIEWLYFYDNQCERINFQNVSKISIKLSNSDNSFQLNDLEKRNVWIRRGKLSTIPKSININLFYNYLKKEENPVLSYCEKILLYNKSLIGSSQEEIFNNKVLNLMVAKKCGLNIPNTLITNKKIDLQEFYNKNKPIITKSLFLPPNIKTDTCSLNSLGTVLINQKEIDLLNDNFSLSLVQKYVKKKYEVRTFIFKNRFYSMAIFSQGDNKTSVDYRNYNKKRPNRTVPFKLPKKLKLQVKKMMRLKKIHTGSIDFIVTPNNEFYFLEINPQGQIDWLSQRCNYYIEKDIAKILSGSK